jgi:hypothetical protein
MADEPSYAPNRKPPPPRQPQPGEEVRRLHNGAGRTQTCELRNDEQVGAGWDVMLLEDGEPFFSRRYGSEAEARFAAENLSTGLAQDRMVNVTEVTGAFTAVHAEAEAEKEAVRKTRNAKRGSNGRDTNEVPKVRRTSDQNRQSS